MRGRPRTRQGEQTRPLHCVKPQGVTWGPWKSTQSRKSMQPRLAHVPASLAGGGVMHVNALQAASSAGSAPSLFTAAPSLAAPPSSLAAPPSSLAAAPSSPTLASSPVPTGEPTVPGSLPVGDGDDEAGDGDDTPPASFP